MTAPEHVRTKSDYRTCDNSTVPNASIHRKNISSQPPKKNPTYRFMEGV
jgi:hypothetical protein